ncbi:hypothetical protein ACWDUX_30425 [Streptomyces sp. NPDC003444]
MLGWTPGEEAYRLTVRSDLTTSAVIEGQAEDAFDIEPETPQMTRALVAGLERGPEATFMAYILAATADLSGEVRWTPAVSLPGSLRGAFEAAS